MERYLGSVFLIKYLFLNYLILAGPPALIALCIGFSGLCIGLFMLFFKNARRYSGVLFMLALASVVVGGAGSATALSSTHQAALLEEARQLTPSAARYNDLQYGYSTILLYLFPLLIGVASAIPSLLFGIIFKLKHE